MAKLISVALVLACGLMLARGQTYTSQCQKSVMNYNPTGTSCQCKNAAIAGGIKIGPDGLQVRHPSTDHHLVPWPLPWWCAQSHCFLLLTLPVCFCAHRAPAARPRPPASAALILSSWRCARCAALHVTERPFSAHFAPHVQCTATMQQTFSPFSLSLPLPHSLCPAPGPPFPYPGGMPALHPPHQRILLR